MFKRYDVNDVESWPFYQEHQLILSHENFGKKEIPNVKILIYERLPLYNETNNPSKEVFLDCLTGYFEEFDSSTGWKVVLESALMSPKDYEILTNSLHMHYTTQAEEIWRSQKTGKDIGFEAPVHKFNHMSIKHKVKAEGDPAHWYITFWNEYEAPEKPKDVSLERPEI